MHAPPRSLSGFLPRYSWSLRERYILFYLPCFSFSSFPDYLPGGHCCVERCYVFGLRAEKLLRAITGGSSAACIRMSAQSSKTNINAIRNLYLRWDSLLCFYDYIIYNIITKLQAGFNKKNLVSENGYQNTL